MKHKHDFLLSGILVILALLLRLYWIVLTDFNGLYGQDAFAYYDFALELRLALNEWRVPQPFFWGLGYPSLLMVVFSVFGTNVFIAQMLNVVLGSMLVVLVYILARQLGCSWFSAMVAALLMAVCGQAVQSSIVIMADIPALFWATLSVGGLIRYIFYCRGVPMCAPVVVNGGKAQRPSPTFLQMIQTPTHYLLFSTIFLTIAGMTRWLYFGLAPLWALVVFIHWRKKIYWRESVIVIVIVLSLLIPQFAYSRTTPFPTFNHAWVVGWSPMNALQQSFVNADGQFYYATPNYRFYAAPLLDAYYLSPVLIVFVLAGLRVLWRKNRLLFVLLVGWIAIPYLFLIGIPYQNIRFPLIVFPPLAVLIGVGVQWVIEFRRWRWFSVILTILLCAVAISHTLKTSNGIITEFITRQQQDKAIAAWVTQRLPTAATLYTFEVTLILRHETPYTIYDLFYETPASLDTKWLRGQNDFLLVNGWSINHQWRDREPYIATYWLANERGIVRIGRYGNYTLYRVRG